MEIKTSELSYYVVTGRACYDDEIEVLALVAKEDGSENVTDYFISQGYVDVDAELWTPTTYKKTPCCWSGNFSIELRPTNIENTYIIGCIHGFPSKIFDAEAEWAKYTINTVESSDEEEITSKIMQFRFCTKSDVPDPRDKKAFRRWVIDSVNALGKIKLVIPSFDD